MKKLNFYDQLNAATLLLVSPEWRKVKAARQSAVSFETPDVTIPTEIRTIAGRNIRLAEAGPADAPLVVLLSPFPESILSYTGCWEALTEKCRVIAIDLPGFGASEGDRKDMSPSAQGAHLAAIFDELDLQNIHLVAPDVGMAAALAYVLNHKHRVTSLAVGHGLGAPGPFKLAFMVSMLAKFGFMRFTTGLLGAGPLIAFTSKLGAIRNRANAKQIDDYKRAYSGRAGEVVYWFKDFRSRAKELAVRLKEIEIPTLVFWGELDVMFDPSNAEHLHAALPQSKLQILPEAGHTSWADQPELFADMIIDWVASGHK
ncbi:predicted Hydrolase or acyltransferase (alpha/beta hydrolase superfamily) protein [marine gamma proteobacterium HTCC2143]|jgi:pimeloyl-ACP methyl ester carboxylesterase|uniref:Predicted Hydrolase or acyltransferase (Alpha/beta hydrolase superfamily) protein n=1 Tax=marine gamma proteobacterium HTCC2143 TaxID=247633 RepID=A0YHX0_9GAMM|nr:predicted Hydrolase or acyltransferase (alpha/beta hydrolase superfamily) protein [marine gamma proteobacterium HTCC2143]